MPIAVGCLFYTGGEGTITDLNKLQAYFLRSPARANAYLMFESHLGGKIFHGNKVSGPEQLCEEGELAR